MMSTLCLVSASCLLLLVNHVIVVTCGNYTVTDEAWFEVEVKGLEDPSRNIRERFTIALFGEAAPMTVLNFVSLVKGYKKKNRKIPKIVANLSYKNSKVHRIVPDLLIQLGDITRGDGTGGVSIYGERFNDEDFILSHRSPGWVAMANHGPNTNASQFFILLTKARWLDGKHVVFGKVIRGLDVVRKIGEVPADDRTAVPKHLVLIVDCGLNSLKSPYDLTEIQLDMTQDL